MAATVDSTDRKAQAGLLADMAALNFRAGRVGDAAACFQQLQQQFAEVPCHAGMTSSQWLAVFPDGDALRREVARKAGTMYSWSAWPTGEVETSQPNANGNSAFNPGFRFERPLDGPSGPFFTDCTVNCDGSQQEIGVRDGLGRVQKPIKLVENGRMLAGVFFNTNQMPARCFGHLLVLPRGRRFLPSIRGRPRAISPIRRERGGVRARFSPLLPGEGQGVRASYGLRISPPNEH